MSPSKADRISCQPGNGRDRNKQRVPVGGRIQKLNEREGGEHQTANQSRRDSCPPQNQKHQTGLDHGQQSQRIAHAHHAHTKKRERGRVHEVDVSGVQILNVSVECLTGKYSLGNMGELALVNRRPESVVINDHEEAAEKHHHEKSTRGAEIPIAGSPACRMIRILGDRLRGVLPFPATDLCHCRTGPLASGLSRWECYHAGRSGPASWPEGYR